MTLQEVIEIELPIIQAPMAGVQGSALAVAVSNAGGMGSLPCAMLGPDAMRKELTAITSQTRGRPFNVNFFCHVPPKPDPEQEAAWRRLLSPYYYEYGVDPEAIPAGPGRAPFSHDAADALSEFKPPVVSFHFGLPSPELLARLRAWNPIILSSATTVEEARWLEAHGADAIIAHVGTTIGGSIGVKAAVITMDESVRRVQAIIDAGRSVRKDIVFLSHGGPIATPEDAAYINARTDAVGFVGASSLERLAVEGSLMPLTKEFKKIPVRKEALRRLQFKRR